MGTEIMKGIKQKKDELFSFLGSRKAPMALR